MEKSFLRFVFPFLLWVFSALSCTIAWTETTTKLPARLRNTSASAADRVWGLVAGRGGSLGDNDEGKKQQRVQRFLVLMDVFCDFHGGYLTEIAREVYGVHCVHVLSDYMADYVASIQQQQGEEDNREENELPSIPRMPSAEAAIEWRRDLVERFMRNEDSKGNKRYDDIELTGLICESDPGLADAERLSTRLNITYHNGVNEARRNKYLTISTVASKGIPTVRQKLCDTMAEATEFATKEFTSFSAKVVVVKPVRGCASDDVFLCDSLESVASAYETIRGSTVLGSPTKTHESVLVQEYAVGQEYAIDTISKDGKLKIAAVWKYDKRPQPPTIEQHITLEDVDDKSQSSEKYHRQVYYATRIYDDDNDDDPLLPIIYEYLEDCLNSLDIRWGITHSELIITSDGPRLVEVNCRQHNMNFVPLTDNAIGYNLYDMLLAAYFGDENDEDNEQDDVLKDAQMNWDLLPDYPSRRMNAAMVHLVNNKKGVLKHLNENALYEIQSMESVLDLEVFPEFLEPGVSILAPTVDIKTDAGWIQMLHPDPDVFERDYQRIMELMPTLFEV